MTGRTSLLRRAMADEPFARWLVDYCEGRGLRTGRQAAKALRDADGREFNPAVFGTWVRGAQLPDDENQQRLAEATGEPAEHLAELVRRTKRARRRGDEQPDEQASSRATSAEMHTPARGPAGVFSLGSATLVLDDPREVRYILSQYAYYRGLTEEQRRSLEPDEREIVEPPAAADREGSDAGGGGARGRGPG